MDSAQAIDLRRVRRYHSPSPRRLAISQYRLLAAFAAAIAVAFATTPAAAAAPSRKPVSRVQPGSGYERRDDVRAFIDELVREQGFSRQALVRWFRDVRYQPKIVDAMQRPLVAPPAWFEYAPQFLSPARIDGGVAFWREHAGALARAEAEFGVPPEIVVAIIGVETFYGRNVGGYRVIDALTTLAFDYPRRGAFFRGELRDFLLLARDEQFSPLVPKGSFAGAFGVPQFMPGSVRRYALDYDGDGHIDLWHSADDAIGSIANYLARHDWLRGQPVWSKALIAPSQRDATLQKLDGGLSERRPLAAWNADGVAAERLPDPMSPEPVGLLALEEPPDADADGNGGDAQSVWVVFPNFYVITRYNKSRLYAAAVTSLGEAIRAGYDEEQGSAQR
jgi:membrane-bound lytic murein transglycosylase B